MEHKTPFRRNVLRRNILYCCLQGIYCMLTATVVSYASVYLSAHSYSSSEIGLLLAIGYILSFILQPTVAGFTDRAKRITVTGVIALCSLAGLVLTLACLLCSGRSTALSCLFVLLFAATMTVQPLTNAYASYLERLQTPIYFGVARGIGSMTYAILSVFLGRWTQNGAAAIPISNLFLFGVLIVLMGLLRREGRVPAAKPAPTGGASTLGLSALVTRYRSFLFLLLGTAVLFFSHELIANFLFQIISQVGAGSQEMGALLSFAAILELPVLVLFDRLHRKWDSVTLIRWAVVLYTVRCILFYFATSMPVLYLAQTLEAPSYAILLAASVSYANETVDQRDSNKAQALITAMMTLGGIFSSALGGVLLDHITVKSTLAVCSVISIFGTLLVLLGCRRQT